MNELFDTIKTYVSTEQAQDLLWAAGIFLVGIALARVVSRRLSLKRLSRQHQLLVRRFGKYGILVVSGALALQQLGIGVGVLLGAAGVLSVAIGFAAQTSASNLISGLFLMAEQPFVVGDIIRTADTTGEVVSIDLLSVRLRTFDGLLVRIPNESMLKSNVTNLTHFPIRRLDMKIGVAYKEDLARVREVLLAVAEENPVCLEEPHPIIIMQGYGDSSVDLQLSVWATIGNQLELRNTMYEQVKTALDEAGIEIPFPHVSVYAGAVTEPMPVRVVD